MTQEEKKKFFYKVSKLSSGERAKLARCYGNTIEQADSGTYFIIMDILSALANDRNLSNDECEAAYFVMTLMAKYRIDVTEQTKGTPVQNILAEYYANSGDSAKTRVRSIFNQRDYQGLIHDLALLIGIAAKNGKVIDVYSLLDDVTRWFAEDNVGGGRIPVVQKKWIKKIFMNKENKNEQN